MTRLGEGFVMTRIFGLLIAVLAFAAPANAALLVSYDFATDAKAKVFTTGLTARDFNQIGMAFSGGTYGGAPAPTTNNVYTASVSGRWQAQLGSASLATADPNQSTTSAALVRVENTTGFKLNLTSFQYELYNATADATPTANFANRLIYEQTAFRKTGDTAYGNLSAASNTSLPSIAPNGSTGNSTGNGISTNRNFFASGAPLVLNPGEFVEIRVLLKRNNVNAAIRTFQIDNFQIHGDVIPEPASVAIFGGIAAIGVVRRIRRKS